MNNITEDDFEVMEDKICEAAELISFRKQKEVSLLHFFYAFACMLFDKIYDTAPSRESAEELIESCWKAARERPDRKKK